MCDEISLGLLLDRLNIFKEHCPDSFSQRTVVDDSQYIRRIYSMDLILPSPFGQKNYRPISTDVHISCYRGLLSNDKNNATLIIRSNTGNFKIFVEESFVERAFEDLFKAYQSNGYVKVEEKWEYILK